MQYLITIIYLILIVGCSEFQTRNSTTHEVVKQIPEAISVTDLSTPEPDTSSATHKLVTDPVQPRESGSTSAKRAIQPTKNLSSRSTKESKVLSQESTAASSQTSIDTTPLMPLFDSVDEYSGRTQATPSSAPSFGLDHYLDTVLDQDKTQSYKQPPVDYSAYGFITPTESLETLVNEELRLLREEPTAAASGTPNLLDRLPSKFKLDLSLRDARISEQLNWFVSNPNYLNRAFNKSARFLFHIAKEVEKRNMPMELALLPLIESAYDPFAYSHGRASGIWQFIPETGKLYGLHQNWWYDGRRDVLASTQAALNYLKNLQDQFDGNWLHAIAAYNAGSGRILKAINNNAQQAMPTDFWSLDLSSETQDYVPKLLALARIVAHPEDYDLKLPFIADKPYFEVVDIQTQIDIAQAAKLAELDIDEIYQLNPGFNQWATAPLGPHRLLIPVTNAKRFAHNLKTLPPEKRLTWNRYSVKQGDSLISIARTFNTTPGVIKQVNQLRSNSIRENQKLLIPIAAKKDNNADLNDHSPLASKQNLIVEETASTKLTYTVEPGDTLGDLARKHKVGIRDLAKWNDLAPTDILVPGKKLTIWSRLKQPSAAPAITIPLSPAPHMIKQIGYLVKKGESLTSIARKFSVQIDDLVIWNKLDRDKHLQPGQKLAIFVNMTNG